jgi:hypothetical protein
MIWYKGINMNQAVKLFLIVIIQGNDIAHFTGWVTKASNKLQKETTVE